MTRDGDRVLREWAGLVDRALSGTGVASGRPLDRPDLRTALLAVPPEVFFPRRVPAGLASPSDGLPGAEVAATVHVVAQILDALDARPADRVLEVGTGTGYTAALLASLARTVHTVERRPEVAEAARAHLASLAITNVHVVTGDGSDGHAGSAPYDAILISAGGGAIPQSWRSGAVLLGVSD